MHQTIPALASAATPGGDSRARRQVAVWLLICCALVFAMVVVGGVTRLTRSGLSIVEWQPLVGAIPPLTESHWQELFDKYQQTPEYPAGQPGHVPARVQRHLLVGIHPPAARPPDRSRFLRPAAVVRLKRKIEAPLVPRLVGIFLLGGLQGAVGWWMVKSGLIDDPRVSHVRLSIHLGIAFRHLRGDVLDRARACWPATRRRIRAGGAWPAMAPGCRR